MSQFTGSTLLDRPDIGQASVVRRPRGVVLLNEKPISVMGWEIERRAHFAVDVWKVELECWQQPEDYGLVYWAGAPVGTMVEIKAGFLLQDQDVTEPPEVMASMIIGQVDDVEIDPVRGIIELHGRSLAAKFVDSKTTNKWPDHTASQIATRLAQDQGLTPEVTETRTPIGQYYNGAYAGINRSISEWELLTFLAQREGFECFVIGTVLYFGPLKPDPKPFPVWVQRDQYNNIQSNSIRLRMRRSLTLAQDITVSVISHDYWKNHQVRFTATRRSRALGGTQKLTPQTRQAYILRRPGLSPEQAQQLATNTLADLTKFEKTLEVTMEGNPMISVQRQIVFSGTQTEFDQLYYVDKVVHRFAFERGYEMDIHAKNIPPTSTELQVAGTPAEILPPGGG